MAETNPKVQQVEALIAAGLSVSEALNRVLGGSTAFADRNGFRQPEVTMCFRAYHQRTYPEIRDAAARELDATREWIDGLIDNQKAEPAEDVA